MKVELDLSSYVLKAGFKKCNRFHISHFPKKADLANSISDIDNIDIDKFKNVSSNLNNLKSKVDKLGVGKLVPVPDDLSKLSGDVIKNGVSKKDVYNAKIKDIEDKIPDITNLAT